MEVHMKGDGAMTRPRSCLKKVDFAPHGTVLQFMECHLEVRARLHTNVAEILRRHLALPENNAQPQTNMAHDASVCHITDMGSAYY